MDILAMKNIPQEELVKPENKTIMVLGGADTGKTSLIEGLINLLIPQNKVGIVDCDIGQSHLGPPTTISWGLLENEFTGWEDIVIRDFYFTGYLSPADNLLSALTGLKLIHDKAQKFADKIIVDTTGFIERQSGTILKESQIELIKPHIILALQKEKELESILDTFKNAKDLIIYRIDVSEVGKYKNPDERVDYRHKKFTQYFHVLNRLELNLKQIGVRNIGANCLSINSNHKTGDTQPLKQKQELTNCLISLRDGNNEDIALGIIDSIDINNHKIVVLSPLSDENRVKAIVIGNINVTL